MEVGQPTPDFELSDLSGNVHKLRDYLGSIVILNFWSAECPHSGRTDRPLLDDLARWGDQVVLVPIASNRNESIQLVEEAAKARRLPPVLLDRNNEIADLYEAITTPHVFVIDPEGNLRYRGAVDDVKFRQPKATRFYLEEAIDALLDKRKPAVEETPAYGCAIVREI